MKDESYEEYIPEGYYFVDDLDGGRLVMKEVAPVCPTGVSVMAHYEVSNEQHAEVGSAVAELKTHLHEAENQVSAMKFHEVDWDAVLHKSDKLTSIIKRIRGGSKPDVPPPAAQNTNPLVVSETKPSRGHK